MPLFTKIWYLVSLKSTTKLLAGNATSLFRQELRHTGHTEIGREQGMTVFISLTGFRGTPYSPDFKRRLYEKYYRKSPNKAWIFSKGEELLIRALEGNTIVNGIPNRY